jgi:hypothetical protein
MFDAAAGAPAAAAAAPGPGALAALVSQGPGVLYKQAKDERKTLAGEGQIGDNALHALGYTVYSVRRSWPSGLGVQILPATKRRVRSKIANESQVGLVSDGQSSHGSLPAFVDRDVQHIFFVKSGLQL